VYSGNVGALLRSGPDTFVEIDLAYAPANHVKYKAAGEWYLGEPPLLAIEILSPFETVGAVAEKISAFLDTGVALVWVVDPEFRTVTAYRPDAPPELFHEHQDLTAEPHLPGFSVPVAEIFEG
jgi:Uma2 family endonuclease